MKIENDIKTIVTHAGCPDGIASAIILKSIWPNANVIFLYHNSEDHRNLEVTDGMIFCDFIPHYDRVQEFIDAGTYVLDHHKGTKKIIERFGKRGVYADEKNQIGVSGATLAFNECVKNKLELENHKKYWELKKLSTLAGIRDCWVKDHYRWIEACEQATMLVFMGADYFIQEDSAILPSDLDYNWGKFLYQKNLLEAKAIAEKKIIIRKNIGFIATNKTSDVAEAAWEIYPKLNVLAGFTHIIDSGTLKLIVSLRSRENTVDVNSLAKKFGGGGHFHAAGFSFFEKDLPKGNIINKLYKMLKN